MNGALGKASWVGLGMLLGGLAVAGATHSTAHAQQAADAVCLPIPRQVTPEANAAEVEKVLDLHFAAGRKQIVVYGEVSVICAW